MKGNLWDNVVSGSKELIKFAKDNHISPKSIQVVLIFFDNKARIVIDTDLGNKIPEDVWKMNGGGTNFNEPFIMGFEELDKIIKDK